MKRIIIPILISLIFLHSKIILAENGKTYFTKDEYGALYWTSEKDWKHQWLFKTKFNFKSIKIVIADQDDNQKILVDNEIMNHSPFWFGFRLNEPELSGSYTKPTLAIPYGYSRIGYKPTGAAKWAYIKGRTVVKTSYNDSPNFDDSGGMIIAVFETTDEEQKYEYTISIIYEIE